MSMEKLQRTAKALIKHEFKAEVFATRQEALNWLLAQFNPGQSVGLGGSVTLRQMDLPEKLKQKGVTVISHWEASEEEKAELRALFRKSFFADAYMASANAITEDGAVFNVDGNGNRVAAMIYGPERVYVVAGVNKIVPDAAAAEKRLEEVAAPLNAKRLDTPNPCKEAGKCMDCNSPRRSCRIYTLMKRPSFLTEVTVVLIDEELGF